MSADSEIIVIGAGAAGLSAALDLAHAGKRVTILEARDRLGGRMFTRNDGVPIELGAEFIHGFAPEIFEPLQQNGIPITEVSGQSWCQRHGQICACDFFEAVDRILSEINDKEPDEAFSSWIERKFPNFNNDPRLAEAKQNVTRYVVGFNAADADKVSVHWLAHNMQADEKIQGERAFRMAGGYATLIELFRKRLQEAGVEIQLDCVVEYVQWSPEGARLKVRNLEALNEIRARRVLITVPAGVLQAKTGESGGIHFDPPLPLEKKDALKKIIMGKVTRVTLRFRERFWENIHPPNHKDLLANLGFLFSEDDRFPTWWTMMPQTAPVITGWAPAHYAEKLSCESDFMLMQEALESLSSIFKIDKESLEGLVVGFYSHDWQSDPFARGAYTYVRAGGEGAQKVLGAPVENTLFFAGEATDTSGHNGTVHGAIASGRRAAKEILNSQ